MAALEVTPNGYLWAVDSGVSSPFGRPSEPCPAKIVVYDLVRENSAQHRSVLTLPQSVAPTKSSSNRAIFRSIVLDFGCHDKERGTLKSRGGILLMKNFADGNIPTGNKRKGTKSNSFFLSFSL